MNPIRGICVIMNIFPIINSVQDLLSIITLLFSIFLFIITLLNMASSRDEERQALLGNTEKRSSRSHQFFVTVAALLVISSVGVVVSLLHQDASGTNVFFIQ